MTQIICSDCGAVQGYTHGKLCSKNPENTTAKLLLLILAELKDINSIVDDIKSENGRIR